MRNLRTRHAVFTETYYHGLLPAWNTRVTIIIVIITAAVAVMAIMKTTMCQRGS